MFDYADIIFDEQDRMIFFVPACDLQIEAPILMRRSKVSQIEFLQQGTLFGRIDDIDAETMIEIAAAPEIFVAEVDLNNNNEMTHHGPIMREGW